VYLSESDKTWCDNIVNVCRDTKKLSLSSHLSEIFSIMVNPFILKLSLGKFKGNILLPINTNNSKGPGWLNELGS